jgi:hypothetical protein
MNETRVKLLTVSETLARLGDAVDASGKWSDAASAISSLPKWAGEAGAIRREGDGSFLLWLAPHGGRTEAFPSSLVLSPREEGQGIPGGTIGGTVRRSALTWDTGKRAITGSEICSGLPIVVGPPFDGAALIVRIEPIGRAGPSMSGHEDGGEGLS